MQQFQQTKHPSVQHATQAMPEWSSQAITVTASHPSFTIRCCATPFEMQEGTASEGYCRVSGLVDLIVTFPCLTLFWFGSYILSCGDLFPSSVCWISLVLKISENTILPCPGIQRLGERLLTSKSQSKGLDWNRLLKLLSQEGFFATLYKDEVT